MEVVIDTRETKLIEQLPPPVFSTALLDNGDIHIRDGGHQLMIERKTWCDLYASILDGRYREQRARLLSHRTDCRKIIYIIEGDGMHSLDASVYDMCRRTLYRLAIAYDIIIVYTKNVQETAEWVQWMIKKNTLDIYFQKRDGEQDRIEAVFQRNERKSIQTPKTVLIGTLLSMNGVSYSMANAIAHSFHSLVDFLQVQDQPATAEAQGAQHPVCIGADVQQPPANQDHQADRMRRAQEIRQVLTSLEYTVEKTKNTRKMSSKLADKILLLLGFTPP